MKDYYYILGLKQSASTDEIKKAHRKLSLKFHPDTNEGDEFFAERFKEIQEAYEILVDSIKRSNYDIQKRKNSSGNTNNNRANFNPEIEYFKANKSEFEYDEDVTFSWKTINSDNVTIRPFGKVPPIGQKTYKLKEFKKAELTFELTAENTNIARQSKTSLTLSNKTYRDLYIHFKEKIINEEKIKANHKQEASKEKNEARRNDVTPEIMEDERTFYNWIWFQIILTVFIIIFIIAMLS